MWESLLIFLKHLLNLFQKLIWLLLFRLVLRYLALRLVPSYFLLLLFLILFLWLFGQTNPTKFAVDWLQPLFMLLFCQTFLIELIWCEYFPLFISYDFRVFLFVDYIIKIFNIFHTYWDSNLCSHFQILQQSFILLNFLVFPCLTWVRIYLKNRKSLAHLEMLLKSEVFIFVIQVKTFREKTVLRNIVYPYWVSQCFGKTQFGSYYSIFLEMIHHLKIQ